MQGQSLLDLDLLGQGGGFLVGANQQVHAQRVLEINPEHEIYGKLKAIAEAGDKDKLTKYAKLLYTQALLIEGMPIDNPVEFSNLVCELM